MVTKSQLPNRVSYIFFSSFTMNSENSLVLLSDELETEKTGVKAGADSHISQIPGLSPTISSVCEEKARGRRVAIQESDSDYVKLAKQGGHKGLLRHDETTSTSKPTSYKPLDWFGNESGGTNKRSTNAKTPEPFQPLNPPFWTDTMTTWERNDGSSNKDKKNGNDHCEQTETFQSLSQFEASKYKKIVFDKKPAPVDMSKLLSFGYVEDNKPVQ